MTLKEVYDKRKILANEANYVEVIAYEKCRNGYLRKVSLRSNKNRLCESMEIINLNSAKRLKVILS